MHRAHETDSFAQGFVQTFDCKQPAMNRERTQVKPVAIPARSVVTALQASSDLADAFVIELPCGASRDPVVLARFIISAQPPWIGRLLSVRDVLVAGFGLKTAKHLAALAGAATGDRIGIFKIYSRSDDEIVMGEDDKHLDFRMSILRIPDAGTSGSSQLTFSTVVHCHNLLGRVYILLIAPFHRLAVKASLHHAARLGWPESAARHDVRTPSGSRPACS